MGESGRKYPVLYGHSQLHHYAALSTSQPSSTMKTAGCCALITSFGRLYANLIVVRDRYGHLHYFLRAFTMKLKL